MRGRPINNQSRLSQAIISRGTSMQDVSLATGISMMRLRHATSGRRPLHANEWEALARHLRVSTDYLIGAS